MDRVRRRCRRTAPGAVRAGTAGVGAGGMARPPPDRPAPHRRDRRTPTAAVARSAADRQHRYRARQLLAAAPPVASWDHWLAARAERRPVWAHPGVVDALRGDRRVHPGGVAVAAGRIGFGSAGDERPVLYVAAIDVAGVVSDYQLEAVPDGQVHLRLIPSGVPAALLPAPGARVPLAVALVDIVASADARSRYLARTRSRRLWGRRHRDGRPRRADPRNGAGVGRTLRGVCRSTRTRASHRRPDDGAAVRRGGGAHAPLHR